MSNPQTFNYNPKQTTQADRRRTYTVRDQHGRKWTAVIDIASGGVVAAPIPMFDDTLRTPLKYLTFDPEDLRTMTIDYDLWLEDLRQRQQEWDDHRVNVTVALYGDRAFLDKEPTREILAIIGPKPMAPDRVLAAKAGIVSGLAGLEGEAAVAVMAGAVAAPTAPSGTPLPPPKPKRKVAAEGG